MIVYMLLNEVTEHVYIGATEKTLRERWAEHLLAARKGSNDRFHQALRQWPEELWLCVVLCNCYTVEELSAAEAMWQRETSAHDAAVGYNDSTVPYHVSAANGKRGGDMLSARVKPSSPLAGMTIEQRREFFREAGKRGAAKSRAKG